MIESEELDRLLVNAGMISIAERMEGGPLDYFSAHAGVVDLDTLMTWATRTRREYMEMHALHELGIHVLGDDVLDFVLGKNAIANEFHINLRNVLRRMGKL